VSEIKPTSMKTSSPDEELIERNFTYHAPKGNQAERYEQIRSMAKHVAFNLIQHCPASRERSLAMTKLEECVMWANAAIARNES
jgi:hypothetical protein